MKNYIFTQQELDLIPILERSKYYFDDHLVSTIKGFIQNEEEMVKVEQKNHSFKVQPFWEDKDLQVADLELQEILNKEGLFFRKYIQQNPSFSFLLRKSVVEKLEIIQNQLPSNLQLVLKAGYRPLEVQKWLFDDNFKHLQKKFPSKNQQEIYKINLEFIADPINFIPPHSTGGAVDLYLLDKMKNEPVDMGSPINYPDDLSWTWNMENLTLQQKQNRIFLTEIMTQNGFANLASEWWHYSYGDQYWALFYNKKVCLYNSL